MRTTSDTQRDTNANLFANNGSITQNKCDNSVELKSYNYKGLASTENVRKVNQEERKLNYAADDDADSESTNGCCHCKCSDTWSIFFKYVSIRFVSLFQRLKTIISIIY